MLASITADCRYALRAPLIRRPIFFAASALSIAIGAGSTAAIYAVLHRVLFGPAIAGTASPHRLVHIQPGLSYPNFQDLRRVALPLHVAAMQMGATDPC